MEPITISPNGKPPTLKRIWTPVLYLSIFFLIVSLLLRTFAIVLVTECFILPLFLLVKHDMQITLFPNEKTLQYCYMNCLGKKFVLTIDIPAAQGSYKLVSLSQARTGWQLILFNDKKYKVNVSQSTYKKFELDQLVRAINQIKREELKSEVYTAPKK